MRRHISIRIEFSDVGREDVATVDIDTRTGWTVGSGPLRPAEIAFLAAIAAQAEEVTKGLPADLAAAERRAEREEAAASRRYREGRAAGDGTRESTHKSH